MNYQNTSKELIVKYTKELKLPALKDCLEDVVTEAASKGWDYSRF